MQITVIEKLDFVGVRVSHRRSGLARELYERFCDKARQQGCERVKAITPPKNSGSIDFHRSLGFELLVEANRDGIPVIRDYRGPGEDRVVFIKNL